jgi:hypothetical protein
MKRARLTLGFALAALGLSVGMFGCTQPTPTTPATPPAVELPFTALDTPDFRVQATSYEAAHQAAIAIIHEVCANRILAPCLSEGNSKYLCAKRAVICFRFVASNLRRRGYPV